jgi:hypothetical protein
VRPIQGPAVREKVAGPAGARHAGSQRRRAMVFSWGGGPGRKSFGTGDELAVAALLLNAETWSVSLHALLLTMESTIDFRSWNDDAWSFGVLPPFWARHATGRRCANWLLADHIRFTPLLEGNGDQKKQHDATIQQQRTVQRAYDEARRFLD